MKFLEKDLEDIIFNAPNSELGNRGLPITGLKIRQIRLGNYGISDLITINKKIKRKKGVIIGHCIDIIVYELKKDEVNKDTLSQLLRYMKGVHRYMKAFKSVEYTLQGVMIGKSTHDDIIYLSDVSEFEIFNYDYDYNGISFEEVNNYSLKHEGF
tara:strand:+ start:204 stop:668 length:465 start_codon:yes stop_codon:yes gene_type:complete